MLGQEGSKSTGIVRELRESLALFLSLTPDHPALHPPRPLAEVIQALADRVVLAPTDQLSSRLRITYQPMIEIALRDDVPPMLLGERMPLWVAWAVGRFSPRPADTVKPDTVVFDCSPSLPNTPGGNPFGLSNGHVDRFQIIDLIGCGAYGLVHRAYDTLLQRYVALKTARPEVLTALGREAVLAEACHAATIRHPNVCTVYEVFEGPSGPTIVMELLGRSLRDALRARDVSFPVSEAVRIGRDIACGLAAAHAAGVVLLDVKPANLLWRAETGQWVLTDFGVATGIGAARFNVGTPAYMSPQQRGSFVADPTCDIFAFGRLFYELLALERSISREPLADIDPSLADLILRMTNSNPQLRPTALEVEASLGSFCE